ncbi:hypothetical protein F5Y14DRAFT_452747 [Nemania sp. NC0429]|nr:hypothetical protein F5Y14DRAFT_452747 [Nemania sp. NC0429]
MQSLLTKLCLAASLAVGGFSAASLPCVSQLPAIHLPITTTASLTELDSYFERIVRRPNGDFLVTQLAADAELWLLRGAGTPHARLSSLHNFTESTGLVGIAAVGHDSYIVTAQRFSSFAVPEPNTTVIWEVQFPRPDSDRVRLRKVADVPAAGVLNGIVTLPQDPTIALFGDSYRGQVLRLDVATGKYEVVLETPELSGAPGPALSIGVNGLQIYDGYLYLSNTAKIAFYRIAIDRDGYPRRGARVETLATIPGISGLDDFTFDKRGNIWGVAPFENQAFVLYKKGPGSGARREYRTVQFVAGGLNSSAIPGPTAYAWGAGDSSHLLYVTATGGEVAPINGTYTEPAKVAAIDTRAFFRG